MSGEALWGLGAVEQLRGNPGRAIALHTESLADHIEVGDKWGIAMALSAVGSAAHDLHDYGRAVASYKESLTILTEIGDRFLIAECLEGLAKVRLATGHHDRAARLFGAAEVLREPLGWRRQAARQALHEDYVASMRAALGDIAFAGAWAEGRAMTLEHAMEYALAADTRPEEGHGSPSNVAPK